MDASEGLRIVILRKALPAAGATRHSYGRDPSLELPPCSICDRSLDLVFDFDLTDPQLELLDLGRSGRLRVLTCLSCDLPYAGQLYYRESARGITILRSDATTAFQPWETALPRCAISLAPIPPEQRMSSFASQEDWRSTVEFADVALHQLGGSVFWVQDELEVPCCECASPMRFLGQVASETWEIAGSDLLAGHMFGDMGMIYIHFCDSCRVLATGGSCY